MPSTPATCCRPAATSAASSGLWFWLWLWLYAFVFGQETSNRSRLSLHRAFRRFGLVWFGSVFLCQRLAAPKKKATTFKQKNHKILLTLSRENYRPV